MSTQLSRGLLQQQLGRRSRRSGGRNRTVLAASQCNDVLAEVTGALLPGDSCFAQALEGPKDAVPTTFERIHCDPRHTDAVVLQARMVGCRLFGTWSMALAADSQPAKASSTVHGGLTRQDGPAGDEVLAVLEA